MSANIMKKNRIVCMNRPIGDGHPETDAICPIRGPNNHCTVL